MWMSPTSSLITWTSPFSSTPTEGSSCTTVPPLEPYEINNKRQLFWMQPPACHNQWAVNDARAPVHYEWTAVFRMNQFTHLCNTSSSSGHLKPNKYKMRSCSGRTSKHHRTAIKTDRKAPLRGLVNGCCRCVQWSVHKHHLAIHSLGASRITVPYNSAHKTLNIRALLCEWQVCIFNSQTHTNHWYKYC
jgi:hypothetical protein